MCRRPYYPFCTTNCADCGVGTITLGEWYMVKDDVWDEAWAGRRKSWHARVPGAEILCIGCIEQRLGRTLMACDFTDAPVNDPNKGNVSKRLYDRLTTKQATIKGDAIFDWLAMRMIEHLPEDERERAWLLWKNRDD
jgi:hypothetical protein